MIPRFRFPNYRHQQREWDEHRDEDARALLWQMRTGKSKAVIDLLCYRYERGDVDSALVIAPNGVHSNWTRRELPAHAWEGVPLVAHAWRSTSLRVAERAAHDESLERAIGHRDGLAVLSVNAESIIHPRTQKAIRRFMRGRRPMLVVDECDDFRSPTSRRSRVARGLVRHCPVRRILTGTVVDNNPLAAWAQFELLQPGALGFEKYSDFKAHHARYVTLKTRDGRSYPKLDRFEDLDGLRDRMAYWSSVVLREECDDLPEIVRVRRHVGVSDRAREVHDELGRRLMADIEEGVVVTAEQGGVRRMKLQQCLSGFVVDDLGELRPLGEDNPRCQALLEEVRATPGKAIVWCVFREDIRRVAKTLADAGLRFVEYHGSVRPEDRERAIDSFMSDPGVKVFLGHPRAGGRGLNLSAAEHVIWYSHTSDLILRRQADERATHVGGRSVALTDFACEGTVDEIILDDILEPKRERSDDLAGSGLRRLLEGLREIGL